MVFNIFILSYKLPCCLNIMIIYMYQTNYMANIFGSYSSDISLNMQLLKIMFANTPKASLNILMS